MALAAGIVGRWEFAGAADADQSAGAIATTGVTLATDHAFSVFRDSSVPVPPPAAADKLNQALSVLADNPLAGGVAPRVATGDARRAIEQPEVAVDVGSAGGFVCLAVRAHGGSGSVSCTTAAAAADPKTPLVAADSLGDGRWRVTGLVPQSVRQVSVTTDSGAVRSVSAANNTFTTVTDTVPQEASWTATDGAIRTLRFGRLEK